MIKLKSILLEDMTETPEFKRWFGDSKIVDKDGNPKVMYHGTREKKLTKFDPSTFQKNEPQMGGEGFYFTDRANYALGYTYDDEYNTSESRVGAYYIKIESPAPESMVYAWRQRIYEVRLSCSRDRVKYASEVRAMASKMREWIQSKGHDGFVAVGQIPNNMGEIVVFDPTHIKSATGNDGNFDPNDPDITKENL